MWQWLDNQIQQILYGYILPTTIITFFLLLLILIPTNRLTELTAKIGIILSSTWTLILWIILAVNDILLLRLPPLPFPQVQSLQQRVRDEVRRLSDEQIRCMGIDETVGEDGTMRCETILQHGRAVGVQDGGGDTEAEAEAEEGDNADDQEQRLGGRAGVRGLSVSDLDFLKLHFCGRHQKQGRVRLRT